MASHRGQRNRRKGEAGYGEEWSGPGDDVTVEEWVAGVEMPGAKAGTVNNRRDSGGEEVICRIRVVPVAEYLPSRPLQD